MKEENMLYNFNKLEKRVFDSLSKSDLKEIKDILSSIKDSTLVSGVGGSNVVSTYLSNVLSKKNNIICESVTPRDIIYRNLKVFKNIISCSYSADNYGVQISFNNNLNKYLFSKNKIEGITNITYNTTDVEHSFISLSSTLIPMTICLLYYCDDISIVEEILKTKPKYGIKMPKIATLSNAYELLIGYEKGDEDFLIEPDEIDKFLKELYNKLPFFSSSLGLSDVYEILSGYETSAASSFLESTMVESGMFIPVVHDKYDYCHGRSNLNYQYKNNLIFFDNRTELDKYYKDILPDNYENIISIKRKYDDDIINDYYLTYASMLLSKEFANSLNKDLSDLKYSPLVKKLYHYKRGM